MSQVNRTSKAGLDLIKGFEGLRRRSEPLPKGGWIVGYGHTRSAREGVEVTEREAEFLLRYDLQEIEQYVAMHVHAPLNQNEFDALVSLCWNIGKDAFGESDVLTYVNGGEMLAAAESFSAWRKARIGGRLIVVDALVRRRTAEKNLFLSHPSGPPAAPSLVIRPELDVAASVLALAEGALSLEAKMNGPARGESKTALPNIIANDQFSDDSQMNNIIVDVDDVDEVEDVKSDDTFDKLADLAISKTPSEFDDIELDDIADDDVADDQDEVLPPFPLHGDLSDDAADETADESSDDVVANDWEETDLDEIKEGDVEVREEILPPFPVEDDASDEAGDESSDDVIAGGWEEVDLDEIKEGDVETREEILPPFPEEGDVSDVSDDADVTDAADIADASDAADETTDAIIPAIWQEADLDDIADDDDTDGELSSDETADTVLTSDEDEVGVVITEDTSDLDDIPDADDVVDATDASDADDVTDVVADADDKDEDGDDDSLSRAMAAATLIETDKVVSDDLDEVATLAEVKVDETVIVEDKTDDEDEVLPEVFNETDDEDDDETAPTGLELSSAMSDDSDEQVDDALPWNADDSTDEPVSVFEAADATSDVQEKRIVVNDIEYPNGMTVEEMEAMDPHSAFPHSAGRNKNGFLTVLPFLILSVIGLAMVGLGLFDWWGLLQSDKPINENELYAGPFMTLLGGFALVFGLYFMVRKIMVKDR